MKKLSIFFIGLFLISCSYSGVIKEKDSFTGKETICIPSMVLALSTGPFKKDYRVNFSACKTSDSENILVTVKYHGPDWIFINEKDSLQIKLDSGTVAYSGKKSFTEIKVNAAIMESANYIVKRDFFENILTNKNQPVVGRLYGSKNYVDLDLFSSDINKQVFQNFLNSIDGKPVQDL